MATDPSRHTPPDSAPLEIPEVAALMRLLANLNAGAMFALCLWLAWAAMDYTARQPGNTTSIPVGVCGCEFTEVTDWSGRTDVALRD